LRWWGTYLPVGAVFMRRSLILRLGWRDDLRLLLDWDLWLRAAESGARFRYVARPFVAIRNHPAQESRQSRPDRLEEKSRVRDAHGLPTRPWMWRAFQRVGAIDHGVRKMLSGGYTRQMRTTPLRNRSMLWFHDGRSRSEVSSLYLRGYGREEV
jgi:hypothetical protein